MYKLCYACIDLCRATLSSSCIPGYRIYENWLPRQNGVLLTATCCTLQYSNGGIDAIIEGKIFLNQAANVSFFLAGKS